MEISQSGCWEWQGNVCGGYGRVSLTFSDSVFPKQISFRAHRVAWFYQYGSWPTYCGLHRCDNRICVNPFHVFDGTRKDNAKDRDQKQRQKIIIGADHGMSKLTREQILRLPEMHKSGKSTRTLAKELGVSAAIVRRVLKDSNAWKDVPREILPTKPRAVLTEDDVRYIRNSGETLVSLSKKFGVSFSVVGYARSGRTWKQVI